MKSRGASGNPSKLCKKHPETSKNVRTSHAKATTCASSAAQLGQRSVLQKLAMVWNTQKIVLVVKCFTEVSQCAAVTPKTCVIKDAQRPNATPKTQRQEKQPFSFTYLPKPSHRAKEAQKLQYILNLHQATGPLHATKYWCTQSWELRMQRFDKHVVVSVTVQA